ncbi:MAG TPA: hypothetical protein VH136_05455 [Trebonia sp.]|nr:hypothetical protein [Trebonia sp.]
MNDFERRIRELINLWSTKVSDWWSNSSIKSALANPSASTADLRRQASAQAQRAGTAVKDLRDSDTAKKAATAMKDLRDSDTAKKAATALADLRQREPVRKAEESAKRALQDLRSGHNGGDKS